MSIEEIKEYLSKQFNLPPEQIEKMMPSFIETLIEHMKNLEVAYKEDNLMKLGKAGHTIKGAFLNLGLHDCAEIAYEIELSGKAEDTSLDYGAKISSLQRQLEPVLK